MSALAARRAAAAASATVTPTDSPSPAPKPSVKPAALSTKVKAKTAHSPSPSLDGLETDEENEPQPSSNKRRKVEKSPPAKAKQRYFASTTAAKTQRPTRAFSPSAPAEESGSDGRDSSDEEETAQLAAEEVNEGRMQWSVVTTPYNATPAGTPGPSRLRDRGEGTTSCFVPDEGVNLLRVASEQTKKLGVAGDGDGVLVSLGPDENLLIAGTYVLTPLSRPLSLLSSVILPLQTRSVYAPTSHPIPVIEPVTGSTPASNAVDLSQAHLPSSFRLADGARPRTIFLIQACSSGIESMRSGAIPGFSHVWPDTLPWGLKNVCPVIGSFPTPVYPYVTPDSWSTALTSLHGPEAAEDDDPVAEPLVALIKGAKRSGKSTFGRSLLNSLLSTYERVAWLECDLGQGEFSCGGVVGLWIVDTPVFGPPFTHPSIPHKAHFMGTYTPLTCPDEYLAAIEHLLEHFKYEVQYPLGSSAGYRNNSVVPLVVNTQGWVKGLGEDLLRSIEASATPTHVFAFDAPAIPDSEGWASTPPPPVLAAHDGSGPITQVLEPAPISPLQARYTAADMRLLSLLSYFYSHLDKRASPKWDFSLPLPAQQPWEVTLGRHGAIKAVYMMGEGADGILEEDLALALDGSIVALLESHEAADVVYEQGRVPAIGDEVTMLGYGLIRGVQQEENITMRLLTPLAPSVLGRMNAIAKNGAIELPLAGMLDWRGSGETLFGTEWPEVPFLDRDPVAGVGGERRRYRRNLQRKGQ